MSKFGRRDSDDLERRLRAERPEPDPDFVRHLSARVGAGGRQAQLYAFSRLSFAGALTVLMLGALASFGGLSYAATGTEQAVKAAKRVVAPARPRVVRESSAQDQYQPKKVTICHKGHTITISRSALPAHLAHGDTVGPCPSGGGVAGASGGHTNAGGGVAGTAVQKGQLPFTGLSLGATALLALLLVATGVGLRRRAAQLAE